jgi:transcriptional regulator with XRE-family HTH domain
MPAPLLNEHRLRTATRDWVLASGRRLRDRRLSLDFSQDDLAGLVGVRATSISKFERGDAVPKDQVRLALAHALMCEVNDLWPPLARHYVSMAAAATTGSAA